ncbi:hypothetical protein ACFRFL_14080 [Streptomyces sp. NPDC056708]|uniref:hypothetical protein n=1 Tax=unclassified Streptomyces TaxID=2593676 RepID=UPI0036B0E0CA
MPAQPAPLVPAHELGEAVGKIAAFAAIALHRQYPNLSLEELVETFTQERAQNMLARHFTAGLSQGKTAGDAAGEAGAELIRRWADARLAARARAYEMKAAAQADPEATLVDPSA